MQQQLSFWSEEPAPPAARRPRPRRRVVVTASPPASRSCEASMVEADAELLGQWLQVALGQPVQVVFTRNASTMLSFRHRDGAVRLRLHEMFRSAGEREVDALVHYLRGRAGGSCRRDTQAGQIIDEFIAVHLGAVTAAEPEIREQGRYHHLGKILSQLNDAHFHGACAARITWGTAQGRRRRRSIQLGCYVPELDLIRIHPGLDQIFVPRFYVASIVFHEMLHEVFGFEEAGGRRSVHPPAFTALEQTFPDYPEAKRWEEQNIHRLLRYRPLKEHRDEAA